jgi:hypothetical protein
MANYFDKEEFGDYEEEECNEENNSWDSYLDTMYQVKKVMRVDLGIQCPSMSSSTFDSTTIMNGKESYDNSYMFPIKTCDSLFTPLSKIDKLIAKIYCSPIKRTFVYIPATLSHPKDACHEELVHHFENCEEEYHDEDCEWFKYAKSVHSPEEIHSILESGYDSIEGMAILQRDMTLVCGIWSATCSSS